MPVHSTAPAVKTALLATWTETASLGVTRHHPGDAMKREAVFSGRVRGRSTIPVMRAGRKKREEDYTVEVWIRVAKASTEADAEDRSFELLGELEDRLANDPGLGLGEPTLRATLDGWETETGFDPGTGGWETVLRADVGVANRLS